MTRRAPRAVPALCCLAALVLSCGTAQAMTGREVIHLVRTQLERAGINAFPEIAPIRGFPDCSVKPNVTPSARGWNIAVLSCPSPVWERRIRTGNVPVETMAAPNAPAAAPTIAGKHVILIHGLARGAVIVASDVQLARNTQATPRGTFTSIRQVVGRKLKQDLGAGQTLLARHLQLQWAVMVKGPVAIEARVGTIHIAMPGVALQNGQVGDLVEIRNSQSGRILKGHVLGRNRVGVMPNMN